MSQTSEFTTNPNGITVGGEYCHRKDGYSVVIDKVIDGEIIRYTVTDEEYLQNQVRKAQKARTLNCDLDQPTEELEATLRAALRESDVDHITDEGKIRPVGLKFSVEEFHKEFKVEQ